MIANGTYKFRISLRGEILRAVIVMAAFCCAGCKTFTLDHVFSPGAQDWVMTGRTPERQNRVSTGLVPPFREAWSYTAKGGIAGTVLVQDSIVLFMTNDGEFHALEIATGKDFGGLPMTGHVKAAPLSDAPRFYVPVATGEYSLVCISLIDGAKIDWKIDLGAVETSPVLFGQKLYVVTASGEIVAVNKFSGNVLHRYDTGIAARHKQVHSTPALSGSTLVFGADDGSVFGYDCERDTLLWRARYGSAFFAGAVVDSGIVYIPERNTMLHALRLSDGTPVWDVNTGAKNYAPVTVNGAAVYCGTSDGTLFALDKRTGSVLWSFKAGEVIGAQPLVTDSIVYVSSYDKNLYAIDAKRGTALWKFDFEHRVRNSPLVWGKWLLVSGDDRRISAFIMEGAR